MAHDLRRWIDATVVMLTEASDGWGYHGTLLDHIPSIVKFGLQSNHRAKWSWDDSNRRKFHLLYFSLTGPQGWGRHRNLRAQPHEVVELRFPLAALGRIRWQEDEEREQRDEYYAVSRHDFRLPPEVLEIQYEEQWISVVDFYREHYWDVYRT